jgi:hypothetical protein
MIDVIDFPTTVFQINQHFNNREDILFTQHSHAVVGLKAKP